MTAILADPIRAKPQRKVSRPTPHITLLGMPDAGKSALLGSLARAAEIHEQGLGGRIEDPGTALRELQKQTYAGQLQATRHETVPYLLHIEPFLGVQTDEASSFYVVIADCDGRKASDLIRDAEKPDAIGGSGQLVTQLRRTDALLLVVDALASDEQVASDLAKMIRFVKVMRTPRRWSPDAGAFPVFLVITKCDRLAKSGDTLSVWTERLEARKEQIAEQFRDLISREGAGFLRQVRTDIVMTAITHPALANRTVQRAEPLGVAELFHDAFTAAIDFQARREVEVRRQRSMFVGLGGLAIVLAMFVIVMMLARGLRSGPLAAEIAAYRYRESAAPSHVEEPVNARIEELASIAADPQFTKAASADREFVTDRLKELRKYQEFKTKLRTITAPIEARGTDELAKIETQIRQYALAPDEWAEAWDKSEPGRMRHRLLAEVTALRKAANEVRTTVIHLTQAMQQQLDFKVRPIDWREWSKKTQPLLATSDSPIRPSALIPVEGEPDSMLSYEIVLAYPEIRLASERWAEASQKLARVRDITAAVGLGVADGDLVVPAGFALEKAPAWWGGFKQRFPRWESWKLTDLPEVARADVQAAARNQYQKFLAPARLAIAEAYTKAPGGVESTGKWLAGLRTASESPAMKSWGELARIYLRLMESDQPDPFAAFAQFVSRDSYPIEIHSVRLTIPDDLAKSHLTPASPWILGLQNVNGEVKNIRIEAAGSSAGSDANRATTYIFALKTPARLNYQPGDTLWAELDLKDASGTDWRLTWWGSKVRSRLYQFDRLNHAPRLHLKAQAHDEGDVADRVRLEILPADGMPRLPDFWPNK
ncbi:MAG: hypothetical protein ACJ8C4_21290 [Gemmataceae bacterium]